MWFVTNVKGKNGLPLVRIHSGVSKASADIYLFGATVTSYADKTGNENIFVSSNAIFNGVKAIRGGIPVVFPQFGQPLKDMPQHGFARTSNWSFESSHIDSGSISVTFSLSDNETTLALWPHKFKLEYTVSLSEEHLLCSLKVKNIGNTPFAVHTLLHTYLKIPTIEDVQVKGFKDRAFVDKVDNCNVGIDTREIATVTGEVDRVMTGSTENPIKTVTLILEKSRKQLTVQAAAALTDATGRSVPWPHDVVFWNPWIAKAKALQDLGDLDYKEFLCLEPGTTSDWVTVVPRGDLTLSQILKSTGSMQ